MLTLHEPMKLTAEPGILSLSDAFGERLMSSYDIMTAQITPKELLHLLTNPPEMPLIDGGQSNLSVENRFSTRQDILLSVVNNIVNRVLSEEHGHLTYQDRVYIETTLNKLGITDVRAFMTQVRAMREEHKSLFRLQTLYQQHFQTIKAAAAQDLPAPVPADGKSGEKPPPPAQERRLYLHERIYERLKTAEIYREVYRHMSNTAASRAVIERNELLTAEQFRVSRLLTLHETRRELAPVEGEQLVFLRNLFESGELLPPPETERQVVEQVSAAALVNTVTATLISRTETLLRGDGLWLDLSRAVSQTAENTLSRFISFHEEKQTILNEQHRDHSRRLSLINMESGVLEKLFLSGDRVLSERERDSLVFSHRETRAEPGESQLPVTPAALSVIRELRDVRHVQNVLSVLEDAAVSREAERTVFVPPPRDGTVSRSGVWQTAVRNESLHTQETVSLQAIEGDTNIQTAASETLIHRTEPAASVLPETTETESKETVTEKTAVSEKTTRTDRYDRESSLISKTLTSFSETTRLHPAGDASVTERATVRETVQSAPKVFKAEHTALETERETLTAEHAVSETILREKLTEIDRQNRERIEQVRDEVLAAQPAEVKPPRADRKRMIRDALRAIDAPEQVLLEAMTAVPTEHRPGADGKPDAGLEAVLTRADETTRQIFEAVRIYERNPEEAILLGLLKPGETAVLNAESVLAGQAAETDSFTPADLDWLEPNAPNRTVRDAIEPLFGSSGVTPILGFGGWDAGAVSLVHKSTQTQNIEEWQELLETAKRSVQPSIRETVVEKTENRFAQTQVSQVTQEVRAKSNEEITELVNKTLSRQIGFISDRVYTQLEKRLQGERARRGRS